MLLLRNAKDVDVTVWVIVDASDASVKCLRAVLTRVTPWCAELSEVDWGRRQLEHTLCSHTLMTNWMGCMYRSHKIK